MAILDLNSTLTSSTSKTDSMTTESTSESESETPTDSMSTPSTHDWTGSSESSYDDCGEGCTCADCIIQEKLHDLTQDFEDTARSLGLRCKHYDETLYVSVFSPILQKSSYASTEVTFDRVGKVFVCRIKPLNKKDVALKLMYDEVSMTPSMMAGILVHLANTKNLRPLPKSKVVEEDRWDQI